MGSTPSWSKSMKRWQLSIISARLCWNFASSPGASKNACGSSMAAGGKHSSTMAANAVAPGVSTCTTRFCTYWKLSWVSMAIRVWWFCQTSSQASWLKRVGRCRKASCEKPWVRWPGLAGNRVLRMGTDSQTGTPQCANRSPARPRRMGGGIRRRRCPARSSVRPGAGACLCLAQAVGGAHVGVGQVQLQVPGAEGVQAVGEGPLNCWENESNVSCSGCQSR